MFMTRHLMLALTASALAATPALAGGLLGGGITAPVLGNGSIVGNVTGSVGKSLELTTSRSIDPRGGSNLTAGVAGSVSSVAGAAVGANGLGQAVGLAGSSSTNASTEKEAGIAVPGIGTPARSLAANVVGAADTTGSALAGATSSAGNAGGSVGATVGVAAAGALGAGQQVAASPGAVNGSSSLAGAVSSAANGALSVGRPVVGGQASLAGAANSAAGVALTTAQGAATAGDDANEAKAGAQSRQGNDKSRRNRKAEPEKHPRR